MGEDKHRIENKKDGDRTPPFKCKQNQLKLFQTILE